MVAFVSLDQERTRVGVERDDGLRVHLQNRAADDVLLRVFDAVDASGRAVVVDVERFDHRGDFRLVAGDGLDGQRAGDRRRKERRARRVGDNRRGRVGRDNRRASGRRNRVFQAVNFRFEAVFGIVDFFNELGDFRLVFGTRFDGQRFADDVRDNRRGRENRENRSAGDRRRRVLQAVNFRRELAVERLDHFGDIRLFVGVGFDGQRAGQRVGDDRRGRVNRENREARLRRNRVLQFVNNGRLTVAGVLELLENRRDFFVFVRFREDNDLVRKRSDADFHVRVKRQNHRAQLRERHTTQRVGDERFVRVRTLFQHLGDEFRDLLVNRRAGRNDEETGRRRRKLNRFRRHTGQRLRDVNVRRDRNIANVVSARNRFRFGAVFDVEFRKEVDDLRLNDFRRLAHQRTVARGVKVRFADRETRRHKADNVGVAEVNERILFQRNVRERFADDFERLRDAFVVGDGAPNDEARTAKRIHHGARDLRRQQADRGGRALRADLVNFRFDSVDVGAFRNRFETRQRFEEFFVVDFRRDDEDFVRALARVNRDARDDRRRDLDELREVDAGQVIGLKRRRLFLGFDAARFDIRGDFRLNFFGRGNDNFREVRALRHNRLRIREGRGNFRIGLPEGTGVGPSIAADDALNRRVGRNVERFQRVFDGGQLVGRTVNDDLIARRFRRDFGVRANFGEERDGGRNGRVNDRERFIRRFVRRFANIGDELFEAFEDSFRTPNDQLVGVRARVNGDSLRSEVRGDNAKHSVAQVTAFGGERDQLHTVGAVGEPVEKRVGFRDFRRRAVKDQFARIRRRRRNGGGDLRERGTELVSDRRAESTHFRRNLRVVAGQRRELADGVLNRFVVFRVGEKGEGFVGRVDAVERLRFAVRAAAAHPRRAVLTRHTVVSRRRRSDRSRNVNGGRN